eukprot:6371389-Alexandrium_andersonii.AAC.1
MSAFRTHCAIHRLRAALGACVPPSPVGACATLPGWGLPRAPVQPPAGCGFRHGHLGSRWLGAAFPRVRAQGGSV